MKKHDQRLDLDCFDFQKFCLKLIDSRKGESKNEKNNLGLPTLNEFYEEFKKHRTSYSSQRSESYMDPIKIAELAEALLANNSYLDDEINIIPEDFGVDLDTYKMLRQDIRNRLPSLVNANFEIDPRKCNDVSSIPYPQTEMRTEPPKNMHYVPSNIAGGNNGSVNIEPNTNVLGTTTHNIGEKYQPNLVAQNLVLNSDRYEEPPLSIPYDQIDRYDEHTANVRFAHNLTNDNTITKPSEVIGRCTENIPNNMQQPHRSSLNTQYCETEQQKYDEMKRKMLFAEAVLDKTVKEKAPPDVFGMGNIWPTPNNKNVSHNIYKDQPNLQDNNTLAAAYPQRESLFEPPPELYLAETFKANEYDARDIETYESTENIAEDIGQMQQNIGQTRNLGFMDLAFEMVKQRYENISPPITYNQTEEQNPHYSADMPMDLKRKLPIVEAPSEKKKPPLVRSDPNSRGTENIGIMQQNFNQTHYAQNSEIYQQRYETGMRPASQINASTLPSDNISGSSYNTGVKQQNIGQTAQPSLVNSTFEKDRRRYEEFTRPVVYPQTETSNGPTRNVQYPHTATSSGNVQYLGQNINRTQPDTREMHQRLAQTTSHRFAQNIEMYQQKYAETMHSNMPYQVPSYPNQYSARGRRTRPGCRPPKMYEHKNLQTAMQQQAMQQQAMQQQAMQQQAMQQQTLQQQAMQQQAIQQQAMQQQPNKPHASQYSPLPNSKQDHYYNQQYIQNNLNYNAKRSSQMENQQKMLSHQMAMKQQSYSHHVYSQNKANINATQQQTTSVRQQQHLLQKMEMQQRSYEYYQFYKQQYENKR